MPPIPSGSSSACGCSSGSSPTRASTSPTRSSGCALDSEDRYRLLIDLGRKLEPMPDALKTDATKVRGCSASVWVYPTRRADGRLHFLADSNAAITKGIVALVLPRSRTARREVARARHRRALAPFDLFDREPARPTAPRAFPT
jgi:cysteine desulfuration protein SufE